MTARKQWIGMVVIGVLGAGCGKKPSGGGNGGGETAALPPEIATWMLKDARPAWQGAWVTHMVLQDLKTMNSVKVAVEVKGDKATLHEGARDLAVRFAIAVPCRADFIEEPDPKTAYSYSKQFVLRDGKLRAGNGGAGYRKGKAAVACLVDPQNNLVTIDDKGTCLSWKPPLFNGGWTSQPTTCAWSQDGGKDVLTVGTGDWATKLIADGDLLETEQITREVQQEEVKAYPDFPAAKAAIQ